MPNPNPFAGLTYDRATGGIVATPPKPMAPSDPFGLGLDKPAGPVILETPSFADSIRRGVGAITGAAKLGAQAIGAVQQTAAQLAPRPAVPAGVAAYNVAASRDAGLPSDLVPKYGTMFGADYDARVDQAAAEGRITPQAAEAAKKRRADFYATPFGQQIEGVEAKTQYEQDIAKLKLQQMETEEGLSERALAAKVENDQRIQEEEEAFKVSREALEAEMVGRRKEMDALRADIAATKIDPQNYFQNQSNLAKVLSVISVGIGGFASGYSGGKIPNTALAQLNAAIDRDIEAQKANLSTKRGALAEAQSVYGMARQKLGDDQQAFAYSRALLLDQAKRYAEQLGGEGRTQQIRNAGEQFARTIAFDADQSQRQVLQYHLQRKVAEDALRAQQAFAASPAGRAAAAASAEARDRKERLKELKGQVEEAELTRRFLEATGGALGKQPDERIVQLGQQGEETFLAPTTKAAEELATRQAAATDFRNTVDAMLAAARTGYLPGGVTATSRDINALHATAASQLARSQAGGRTTEQDEQRAKDILPKPAALVDTGEQQALRTLQRTAQGNVEAYRQAVGAKRIVSETVQTPLGPMQRQSLSPDQPKPVTFTPAAK